MHQMVQARPYVPDLLLSRQMKSVSITLTSPYSYSQFARKVIQTGQNPSHYEKMIFLCLITVFRMAGRLQHKLVVPAIGAPPLSRHHSKERNRSAAANAVAERARSVSFMMLIDRQKNDTSDNSRNCNCHPRRCIQPDRGWRQTYKTKER